MCGIAGIINEDGSPVLEEEITLMTRLIAHRGPDHEGFYFCKDFALGHRRLRIIDLSNLSNKATVTQWTRLGLKHRGERS